MREVLIARHVIVQGRVQGVRYRQSAVEAANAEGLAGWVRNLPDGGVEAWLEGTPEAVERMLAWCRQGPPLARVEHLTIAHAAPAGLTPPFIVRGGGAHPI